MKLRNHFGSIVFVLAAAGSAVYGVVLEREGRGPSLRGDGARALASFDRAALTRIELTRVDEHLVLSRERSSDPFRLERPEPWPIDAAGVDELVTALETANALRVVPDPPNRIVRVRGELAFGPRRVRFSLGGPAASPEGAAYLEVEGAGVVVVGRELVTQLLRPFDTFRDRALVPFALSDIARIETRGPAGALTATRIAGASFRVAGGPRVRRETSDRWLSAIPELRASSFLTAAAAPSVAAPSLRVGTADGRSFVVRFGGVCPDDRDGVVAAGQRDDVASAPVVIACVARALAAQFDVAPAIALDDRLFFGHSDEVSEIAVVAASGHAVSLARAGSGFHERRPASRELDADESDAAAALVSRVVDVRGALVARPDVGGAAPAERISVVRVEADGEEAIEIFDLPSGAVAHRLADDAWLTITTAARLALEPPPSGIRADALIEGGTLALSDVTKLAVRCGATTQALTRTPSGFVYDAPAGLAADGARVDELLGALLRARTASAAPVPDPAGACVVTLEATPSDGGPLRRVTLSFAFDDGDGGPSRVIAVRASSREASTLADGRSSRSLERLLREPLAGRTSLSWTAAEPQSISLVQGGKTEVLAGPARDRAMQVLRGLHAERVERLGAAIAGEGFTRPAAEVRLVPADGHAPTTYRFVRTGARGDVLVRRSGLELSARVREEDLAGLLGGPSPSD